MVNIAKQLQVSMAGDVVFKIRDTRNQESIHCLYAYAWILSENSEYFSASNLPVYYKAYHFQV
jgi:hypothetical protein